MPLAPGTRLGVYELQELLGQGGMGDVYRARDTRLDRPVAIKTLPSSLARDPERRSRFEREARLASSLNHPNIVVIYDIGEAGGVHFIAMEHVQGETLAAMIARGPESPGVAADLAAQIADGLAGAHASGVVHRDLKPSNIMVTPERRVKLLDFGLSKLVNPASENASTMFAAGATAPGVLMGTAGYMSPEQALGKPANARSDQFSFGVILYELVARRHPFHRNSSVQTLSAIIEDEPEPLGALNARVPEAMALVIERCLSKDPRERFESTSELALTLHNIADHLKSGRTLAPVPRVRRPFRIPWAVASIVLAALAIGGGLGWWWSGAPQTASAPRQIAVLPLTPIGDEAETRLLSDGLAEVLTTRLIELERFSGSLRVVPATEVRREQVTSARDAYRAFGVDLVVTGSVQRVGDRLRMTLNVVDPLTQRLVSAETVDATLHDVSVLQDEVVLRVARLLGVDVGPDARTLVSAGGTSAPGAYEFYLQSRAYLQRYERPENIDAALGLLERALALDGEFALAHAGLAEASWRKYEVTRDSTWVDRARAAGAKAIELSPRLTKGRITLAMIATGTGRYEEATAALEAVLAEDPTNADAYRELGRAYESLSAADKAESTFLRAIHARPGDWAAYNQLGAFFSRRRNFANAAVQFEQVVALTPDNARGYSNLGGTYAQLRRYPEAIAALEKAVALNPTTAALSNLGTIYFLQSRHADAARAFERATETRAQDYRIWRNLGSAYLFTPNSADKARRAFARAAELAEDERKVNPRQPVVLADLADCYAHLDRVDEARSLIGQAEALAPKDGRIFLLSAQIHEHLGNRSLALEKVAAALGRGITRDDIERTKSLDALRTDPAFKAARD